MHSTPHPFLPLPAERASSAQTFFQAVYWWMFGGLMLTSLAAYWVVTSTPLQRVLFETQGLMVGILVTELVLVFALGAEI